MKPHAILRAILAGALGLFLTVTLVAIAWHGWVTWPRVPLDMSATDPQTRSAFETAVVRHVLLHGAAALATLLIARGLQALLRRTFRSVDIHQLRHNSVGEPTRGPKRILLFRHAEKTGEDGDIHLSKPGFARSKRLATYIPETFGQPAAIFAAPRTRRSIRSMQTVAPLAMALDLPIVADIEDDDFPRLVRRLFSEPEYDGQLIVLCWTHSRLPAMARILGAPADSFPDPWPYELYNAIIDIQYDEDGACSATRIEQPF